MYVINGLQYLPNGLLLCGGQGKKILATGHNPIACTSGFKFEISSTPGFALSP